MWPDECRASDDYYAILGVRSNATADEIREAYRERIRYFRLDILLPPDQVEAYFKGLRTAYEALANPASRTEYDAARQPNGQPPTLLDDSPERLKSRIAELESELARVRRQRDETYRLLYQAPIAPAPDDRADWLDEPEGTPIEAIIAEHERAPQG